MKLQNGLFLLFCYSTTIFAQTKQTAKSIVEKNFDATRVLGVEAVSSLTIIDAKGRKRVRKFAMISKMYPQTQEEKKLIRFLEPADIKGTGFLSFDNKTKNDDIWIFMPALRKSRRIVSSQKSGHFMGSEFSYADMNPPILDNFNYKLLGTEKIDQQTCWKIQMDPKSPEIAEEHGFSKKIMFIAHKDYLTRKALYYDLSAAFHKELRVKNIIEIDPARHKYRAKYLKMDNKLNGRQSIMEINKIQFNPKISDKYFTINYLKKF